MRRNDKRNKFLIVHDSLNYIAIYVTTLCIKSNITVIEYIHGSIKYKVYIAHFCNYIIKFQISGGYPKLIHRLNQGTL